MSCDKFQSSERTTINQWGHDSRGQKLQCLTAGSVIVEFYYKFFSHLSLSSLNFTALQADMLGFGLPLLYSALSSTKGNFYFALSRKRIVNAVKRVLTPLQWTCQENSISFLLQCSSSFMWNQGEGPVFSMKVIFLFVRTW